METLHEEATKQECAEPTKRQLWGTEVVVSDAATVLDNESSTVDETAAEPARESMSGKEARKSETTPAKDAGTNVDEKTDDAYDNEDFPDRYRLEVRNCDTDKLYYRSPPMTHTARQHEEQHETPAELVDRLISEIDDGGICDETGYQLRDALVIALHRIAGTPPSPEDFENRTLMMDHVGAWLRGDSQPWLMPVFEPDEDAAGTESGRAPVVSQSGSESESLRIPCYVVASKDSSPMKVFVDLDPIRAYDDADFYVQQAGEYGIADCHISFDRQ